MARLTQYEEFSLAPPPMPGGDETNPPEMTNEDGPPGGSPSDTEGNTEEVVEYDGEDIPLPDGISTGKKYPTSYQGMIQEIDSLRAEVEGLNQEREEYLSDPDSFKFGILRMQVREENLKALLEAHKLEISERYDIPVEVFQDLNDEDAITKRAMEYLKVKAEGGRDADESSDTFLGRNPSPGRTHVRPMGGLDSEMKGKAKKTGKSTLSEWLAAGGGKAERRRGRRSRL